jgi:hypothetical protein
MLCLLFLAFALVHSTLIASDDFEGSSIGDLAGQNGGTGFTAPWSVLSSPGNILDIQVFGASLSYAGGSEVFSDGGSQAVRVRYDGTLAPVLGGLITRALPAPITTGDVYMSFLYRRDNTDAGGSDNDFVQWGLGAASSPNPSVGVDNLNNGYFARLGATTTYPAPNIFDDLGRTYLLVFKVTNSF